MDTKDMIEKFNESVKYIKEGKLENAEYILKELILECDKYKHEDENKLNYSFNTKFELFIEIVKLNKSLNKKKITWLNEPISKIYVQYAYVLIEKDELDKAKEYIDKALKYNPNDSSIYNELQTLLIKKNNLDEALEINERVGEYALTSSAMAKYYRNLGYLYIEKGMLELAFNIYVYSTVFEKHSVVNNELEYIEKTLNKKMEILPYKQIFEIFKENNIATLPNINSLISLRDFSELLEKSDLLSDKKDLLSIYDCIYYFTGDKNIKEKRDILFNKLNENNKTISQQSNIVENNEITGKTQLISNRNVNLNLKNKDVDELTKTAILIAKRFNIENNIISSSAIEIIKILIIVSLDIYKVKEITYLEFKKTINYLMMNEEKVFLSKFINLSDDTKKQVSKFYSIQEETQTAVMTEILFGLRKVRENELIYKL